MAEGFLARIDACKREELDRRYDGVSLESLRARAKPCDDARSLARALGRNGARFILEIKRSSPSSGPIRANAEPAAIARGYAGVADALSVLCDGPYFGGSLNDLSAARAEFDGPILAKDFFIDLRQVAEARIAGADAILVMLSLLDNQAAAKMIAEAGRFGMDALVEVHDEIEMARARALGANLIGINNRDLRDLSIDLANTERLAHLAPDAVLVSESGIASRADVNRLAPLVDGFLIGSALMRTDEPAQAARTLLFGRTKLCGLKRSEDVRAARPASYAGFIFVPGSPRCVSPEHAAILAGQARRSGVLPVGIFRDAPVEAVSDLAVVLNLHAIQLHGREDSDYVAKLRREVPPGCEIWTALSVGREPLIGHGGDRLLFDNGAGGSGRSFDWEAIRRHPELAGAIIAGGIGVHNATSARRLGAFAIDVGSSLDDSPGIKSADKIATLFEALRTGSRQDDTACA